MAEAASAPWTLADLNWERLTEAGVAALAEDRGTAAARAFAEANRLAEDFAGNDPRRAAALNNAAVATRLADPEAALRRALEGWDAAEAWVAEMALEPRARSSLFHLRLEQKHRARYRELARDDHRRLLVEGRAASEANLTGLRDAPAVVEGMAPGECLAAWRGQRPANLCDLRKLVAAVRLVVRTR